MDLFLWINPSYWEMQLEAFEITHCKTLATITYPIIFVTCFCCVGLDYLSILLLISLSPLFLLVILIYCLSYLLDTQSDISGDVLQDSLASCLSTSVKHNKFAPNFTLWSCFFPHWNYCTFLFLVLPAIWDYWRVGYCSSWMATLESESELF